MAPNISFIMYYKYNPIKTLIPDLGLRKVYRISVENFAIAICTTEFLHILINWAKKASCRTVGQY